ncbi:DinB family protein [Alicyclobacillus shizuokensis]|uniref:DinB family protein n=1 Tax=Alicyclobacillus shizuokensis TaxID=392014 RepID=UPI0008316D67|nr:DinB family protein [Alicyclobacillus shizuokensis]MCL6625338.1 DinB family protein [Alicyclobacillus shizuokensis]
MIQEVSDLYNLLSAVHGTIDQMLEGLTDEQWLKKPLPNFNNIASIIHHMALVERKFFSAVAGENLQIDVGEPFKQTNWNLDDIRQAWAESLPYAARVFSDLKEPELSEPGLKLAVGELNKRQLISYAIAHTAHHRGQIPLVKKLL